MAAPILNARDLEFMLYELFDAEALVQRPRYRDHDRHTFNQVIATGKTLAEKYFLPIRQKLDNEQPTFDGTRVHTLPALKTAFDALVASGFTAATADYDQAGMQLPPIVANVASAYLFAAGSTAMGYTALTQANANLLEAYGSADMMATWVRPMRAGRYAGTMAMTEPDCGSSLGDLSTKAVLGDDGQYRITGNKIFISGGDHSLTENIVHLVLARIQGAPKGVKGISLFVVPKFLVGHDGRTGPANDVRLAGLFHKMGGRGHTSTALNFGEQGGAIGYLVGEANQGLTYMFHMMNEARLMVGTGAAVTALTGFQYALDYANHRPQGRLPSCKDPLSPPVPLIAHADVRRMLLAQKAYAEGAYALVLYGSQLADDARTAASPEDRQQAQLLLDFITPIVKSWPSEHGPRANDLAIQVLGGHGYINEHPVEMFYRDNRLNPIHEGTTGIQSLDLLARKVTQHQGEAYRATLAKMRNTLKDAEQWPSLRPQVDALEAALDQLDSTTQALLLQMRTHDIDLALANSVAYLSLFGHVVVAWLWLRQGLVASQSLQSQPHEQDRSFYQGKLQAMRYFYRYELPHIALWSQLLTQADDTCFAMKPEWF